MSAQGEVKASITSIYATLGNHHKHIVSPNGAVLNDKARATPLGFHKLNHNQPRITFRSFPRSTSSWADIGSPLWGNTTDRHWITNNFERV